MSDIIPDNAIDITPDESVVPVYLVPVTSEELAEREQWAIDADERKMTEMAAEAARQEARESAIAKLSMLGLTEDEVSALLGT